MIDAINRDDSAEIQKMIERDGIDVNAVIEVSIIISIIIVMCGLR